MADAADKLPLTKKYQTSRRRVFLIKNSTSKIGSSYHLLVYINASKMVRGIIAVHISFILALVSKQIAAYMLQQPAKILLVATS